MEKSLQTSKVFAGKLLHLEVHEVQLPTGAKALREVVRHPGAVVVVPRLPDGRFVLVRQFRFAVGESLYEFPAGTLEPGEAPAACAARELVEETGFMGRLFPLGQFYSAPGFCTERLHCFWAEVTQEGESHPEADELLERVFWPAQEVWQAMASGLLRDAKSLAAWSLFTCRQAFSPSGNP
jgi:ADP-ribose pyrophosphatase